MTKSKIEVITPELSKLIRKARKSCKFRGHDMKKFILLNNGKSAYSTCRTCASVALVITNPLPNEIDISGEAVAIQCFDSEAQLNAIAAESEYKELES